MSTSRSIVFRSPRALAGLAAVLVLAIAAFLSVGHLIIRTDPLEPADAIYVLGGSRTPRTVEAARLYQEHFAPRIVLSPGGRDPLEIELDRRGIHVPTEADVERDLLLQLGIPPEAIIVLPHPVDNTAQEADAIGPMAAAAGWKTLIVITDRASTRRAGFAFRRVYGDRLKILMTCNRNDAFNPGRWWTTRWSFRTAFYETPKLLAYWMGLRG